MGSHLQEQGTPNKLAPIASGGVTVDDVTAVEELLRTGGGRSTPVRRTVIRALLDAHDHHVTAPELLASIRRTDPSFQESSLYRTLERLTELGVVRQLHLGPGSAVYHLSAQPHHHLVCDRCGAVEHVAPSVLSSLRRRLDRDHGFELDTDHVTLTGTCARCRATTGPTDEVGQHDSSTEP